MSELKEEFWQVTKECYNAASLKTKTLMAAGVTGGLGFTGSLLMIAHGFKELTNAVAATGSLTIDSGAITQIALGTAFSAATLYATRKFTDEAHLSLKADLTKARVTAKYGL